MKTTVGAAMAGVSVLSLCEKGDAFIMAETGKIFKKEKDMKKGTSLLRSFFHYSPLMSLTQHHPRPPSFTLFLSQVSLFLLVCQLTTAYVITPLWRVTLMSYWRMGTLSKCKLLKLYPPCVLEDKLCFICRWDFPDFMFSCCLFAVIWVCTLMASSQMWLTASSLEWPRYVIAVWIIPAEL